ncbi:MAG: hypothetical protein ABIZ80_25030, partial [Bryobacteraceae bacterium]
MKARWITMMLTASAAVFEQGQGTVQPRIEEVKAALALTEAQVSALQKIQQQEQERDTLQTIRTNIDTKQQALSGLLQKGSTDANAFGRLLVDIQALRTQMTQGQTPFRDLAKRPYFLLEAEQLLERQA